MVGLSIWLLMSQPLRLSGPSLGENEFTVSIDTQNSIYRQTR